MTELSSFLTHMTNRKRKKLKNWAKNFLTSKAKIRGFAISRLKNTRRKVSMRIYFLTVSTNVRKKFWDSKLMSKVINSTSSRSRVSLAQCFSSRFVLIKKTWLLYLRSFSAPSRLNNCWYSRRVKLAKYRWKMARPMWLILRWAKWSRWTQNETVL